MQRQRHFPSPGDTIDGRYAIESELGAGASSRVYAAVQTRLGRRVALKVTSIPPARDTDEFERWSRRFERGARILSELTNPHVVDVYEFGETDDGQLFMAMELVEGQTLKERVRTRPLSAEEAADLGLALLDALSDAHEHGVLHRDIKPDNIMLTADGEVRLLDFGVAKPLETGAVPDEPGLTQEGIFVGTPKYAAPEYLLGGQLGPWCDIYSLGLVLWEAVTGDPMVKADDTQASLRQHMVPEPFVFSAEDVQSAPFAEILRKMSAKDPEQRFRRASQASAALRAFLDGDTDLTSNEFRNSAGPSIDPNLDHPPEFFVNAPSTVPASASLEQEPSPASRSETSREQASAAQQQRRTEDDLSLVSQSIAESHDGVSGDKERDDPSARPNDPPDDQRVPVPEHVETMLEEGERRADRWHRIKWLAAVAALLVVGLAAALTLFAPASWQSALGLTDAREFVIETFATPVKDRVSPEHTEVSAEGVFRVVEGSDWTAISERGEIQTPGMFGWTQDFARGSAKIRVEVYRLEDRAAARDRLDAVATPNRAVRFARRVVILKPLDDSNPGALEELLGLLEEYRRLVDEAAESDHP